jgi:beta-glucosidase
MIQSFFLFKVLIILFMGYSQPLGYEFQNNDLPNEKRVDDLVSRLALEEKFSQVMNIASGIQHLECLPYDY